MNSRLLRQVIAMSKLTFSGLLILGILSNVLLASDLHAQRSAKSIEDIYVSLSTDENSNSEPGSSLHAILKSIEKQSGFYFAFNGKLIDLKQRIEINNNNLSVGDALRAIAKETDYKFRRINGYIHIAKRESVNEKVVEEEVIAQGPTITGRIVSQEDNEGLPGVNVIVKGTTTGTVTDVNGRYSIEVPTSESMLVYSSVGYITEEVIVGSRTVIDLSLTPDITALDEIVVVGYGTVKKSDLTGSVSKVSSDELEKATNPSFDQMLQGRMAGVNVTQQSGAPGANSNIQIRGFNSLGGSQPLFVVDGYPIDVDQFNNPGGTEWDGNVQAMNPLAMLNPNDIESIEVLKDASSTAIYGSRGANGVIMITTKSGKRGTNNVNYNYRFEVAEVGNTYDVLNTRDYMEYVNESLTNDGLDPKYEPAKLDSLVQANPTTNWQDIIYRTAQTHNHALSFTGADDVNRYNLSLNYLDQEGVIINSDFQRFTIRLNASRHINKKLEIGTNSNYTYTQSTAAAHSFANGNPGGSVVIGSIFFRPLDRPFSSDQDPEDVVEGNPVVVANNRLDDSQIQNFYSSLYANLELAEGLVFRFNGGVNSLLSTRDQYQPRLTFFGNLNNGYASRSFVRRMNYLSEFTLRYDKSFNKIHRINAVGGYTWQEWFANSQLMTAGNFINDNLGYERMGAAGTVFIPQTTRTDWALASFLGRVNYSLMNRYLFTFTGRYDGSTRLGEGNKWDFFPSFALGWNLHNEAFMKPVEVISNLKIRASYGLSGNQSIAPNQLVQSFYPFQYPINGVGVTGLTVQSDYWNGGALANPDLFWETTKQFDIGADVGLFDDRLTFAFDYFEKETTNLLLNLNVPISTGFGTYPTNAGTIQNKGWEFELGARLIQEGDFKWNFSGNISHVQNKLVELGPLQETFGRNYLTAGNISSNSPIHIARVGEPVGMFYGYEISGVFQNQEQVQNYTTNDGSQIMPSAMPGDFIYVDQLTEDTDGDGVADAGDGVINNFDRTIIGNPYPDFFFGITNSFSYKGFSLDATINGSIGNDIVNLNLYALDDPNSSSNWNISQEAYDNAWRGEGTSNYFQRARSAGGVISDGRITNRLVEDGSFVRLNNLMLSYDFNVKNLKAIKGARLFIGGRNLITITDYSGYDPEVSGMGSDALNSAVDWGTYPMPRTYYAGVNFQF